MPSGGGRLMMVVEVGLTGDKQQLNGVNSESDVDLWQWEWQDVGLHEP